MYWHAFYFSSVPVFTVIWGCFRTQGERLGIREDVIIMLGSVIKVVKGIRDGGKREQ